MLKSTIIKNCWKYKFGTIGICSCKLWRCNNKFSGDFNILLGKCGFFEDFLESKMIFCNFPAAFGKFFHLSRQHFPWYRKNWPLLRVVVVKDHHSSLFAGHDEKTILPFSIKKKIYCLLTLQFWDFQSNKRFLTFEDDEK